MATLGQLTNNGNLLGAGEEAKSNKELMDAIKVFLFEFYLNKNVQNFRENLKNADSKVELDSKAKLFSKYLKKLPYDQNKDKELKVLYNDFQQQQQEAAAKKIQKIVKSRYDKAKAKAEAEAEAKAEAEDNESVKSIDEVDEEVDPKQTKTKTKTTQNATQNTNLQASIDEENGYFSPEELIERNFFGIDKKLLNFNKYLKGNRSFEENEDDRGKTAYLNAEKGGFVSIDYISQGSAIEALESFQNDVKRYMQKPANADVANDKQYNFTSFVRIKGNSGNVKTSANEDIIDDQYCIVNASNSSIEVNYVDKSTFNEIENEFAKKYKDLQFAREVLSAFVSYGDTETIANHKTETNFETHQNGESKIKIFDEAIKNGDFAKIDELQLEVMNLYYLLRNGIEGEEEDERQAREEQFATIESKLKDELKNKTNNLPEGFLAFSSSKACAEIKQQSEKIRKKNKDDINLDDNEIEELTKLRYFETALGAKEFNTSTIFRHETEKDNYKSLLEAEIPGSANPGIVVTRFTKTDKKTDTWIGTNSFFNKKPQNKDVNVATVLFNDKSENNVMHLFIPNTDFYLKVKRNLHTNKVEIDSENVYRLNQSKGFVSENLKELIKKNHNFETEFNNFQVKAVSYIDGQRHMATLFNGKVNEHKLARKISKDLLFNEDISPLEADFDDTRSDISEDEEPEFSYIMQRPIKNGDETLGYVIRRIGYDGDKRKFDSFAVSVKDFEKFKQESSELKEKLENKSISKNDYLEEKTAIYQELDEYCKENKKNLSLKDQIQTIINDSNKVNSQGIEDKDLLLRLLAEKVVRDANHSDNHKRRDKIIGRKEGVDDAEIISVKPNSSFKPIEWLGFKSELLNFSHRQR